MSGADAVSSDHSHRPQSRRALLSSQFLDDLVFWIQTSPRTAIRLIRIVEEVLRDPAMGIGKPERLKGMGGTWSRRLTQEHRVLYRVGDEHVMFDQARSHYGDR
ncbi:toxin YoeB [Longimicrobium terrae]|nr:toxin YoeB [Longimicrobium terrae]